MNERHINAILCLVLFIIISIFFIMNTQVTYPSNVYPYLIIILLFIFTIVIFINDVLFTKKKKFEETKKVNLRPIIVLVLSIIYFIMINIVGFYTSSAIYLFIMTYLFHPKENSFKRRILSAGSVSILFMSLMWIFLSLMVKIPFPSGFFI